MPNRRWRYLDRWERQRPDYISMRDMELAYNRADSRMYDYFTESDQYREDGSTLLEAIADIAWNWQNDEPGRMVPQECFDHLQREAGINFTDAYHQFVQQAVLTGNPPPPRETRTLYTDQFQWVEYRFW
ncbi:hypothetical protein F5Y04DRAFT_292576 [Hypomontagnella monticulosa]|nr:hypothetical protein F5Y04DRAFT_292576 [Hypomontagnella monticulosa]